MSSEGSPCAVCGATVYKEHLDAGVARYEDGRLMCKHCVEGYEKSHDATGGAASVQFEPIALDSPEHTNDNGARGEKIHGASAATLGLAKSWNESRFKRPLLREGSGATRCRTFHSKLSEAAIDFMTNQMNDWLEENNEIVVKFATSTIGMFEGKHTDPNIIITVFY
jgi:hypothetical protein